MITHGTLPDGTRFEVEPGVFDDFLWQVGDICYPYGRPTTLAVITKVEFSAGFPGIPGVLAAGHERVKPDRDGVIRTTRLYQHVTLRTLSERSCFDGRTERGDLVESVELLIADHEKKIKSHKERLARALAFREEIL